MLIFFACRDCFHMYWPHYLKPWQCLIWEYKNTHTNGQNSCQFVKKAPFSCLHLNYHWSHAQRLNILCSLAPKKALNAFFQISVLFSLKNKETKPALQWDFPCGQTIPIYELIESTIYYAHMIFRRWMEAVWDFMKPKRPPGKYLLLQIGVLQETG